MSSETHRTVWKLPGPLPPVPSDLRPGKETKAGTPQGIELEGLRPLDIEDTVSVSAWRDILRTFDEHGVSYFRWKSTKGMITQHSGISAREQVDMNAQRNAIDAVISLSPEFVGNIDYRLSTKDIGSTEHWLGLLNYPDLAVAAKSLGRQIRERRLADCEEQVSRLNGYIAEDSELYVLLVSRAFSEPDGSSYKVANLKGLTLDATGDKLIPGLVIAGMSGAVGSVPEEYYPFGLYVSSLE